MKKKSVNTTQRLGKKIFIAGKVYDLQVMDKDEVEASVQEYLDSAIGKAITTNTMGNYEEHNIYHNRSVQPL